ncbi:MAG: hypothetical protein ACKVS6_03000, partial [Planctomycetota bacterium]
MTDNPRNLNETDLDRLLSAASEDHRQTQAPGGFSASVMNNISREDALLANSPLTNSTEAKTAASRTWIGVGAAAAFVLLAFAAGWYAGSDLNNSNNVANRGEQNSNVNDPAR